MPMSRRPRSPWLGSSTSPPLITRSNLSSGPIAARAGAGKVALAATEANDATLPRKFLRESAIMEASALDLAFSQQRKLTLVLGPCGEVYDRLYYRYRDNHDRRPTSSN